MARKVINDLPGFKFNPTDEELVIYYLKPKITKQTLLCDFIDTVQLYTTESTPWVLFDIDNPDVWDDEKSIYVFTSLSKVSADPEYAATKSRTNTNKKAGCGTWAQKTPRVPIKDSLGNVIGGKRMLTFEVNEIGDEFDERKAVYFKMHEYSLWGDNDDFGGDLVLCKITFDPSKKPKLKLLSTKKKKKTDHVSTEQKKKHSTVGLISTSDVPETIVGLISTSDAPDTSMSFNSESLITIDGGGVQDLDESCKGLSFDGIGSEGLSFDDFGGDEFYLDDLLEFLDFPQEEELLEDSTVHVLGKRKSIEGDNSCQAKKVCF